MRWVALLAVLAGCDKLFSLDHVTAEGVTPGDGALDDTLAADATPVTCPPPAVLYDEDGDGLDDRCDACPTISSDDTDTDLDGLPDACDPDSFPNGDALLVVATFAQASDVTQFTLVSGSHVASGDGAVALEVGGSMTTTKALITSRVEVRFAAVEQSLAAASVEVSHDDITCVTSAGLCSNVAQPGMCLRFESINQQGELSSSFDMLRSFSLFGLLQTSCVIRDGSGGSTEINTSGARLSSPVAVSTTGARVRVRSIAIYGAK